MRVDRKNSQRNKGFTLIEMIGVLAVIAILAALLIPKIFGAINDARVNNAVVSYNTIKAASAEHYAKYGAFDKTAAGATVTNGIAPPTGAAGLNYWDAQLLAEGFADKLFLVKLGTNSYAQVVPGTGGPPLAFPSASQYDLDGDGNNDVVNGNWVVETIIEGVPGTDAKDVNDRLDGDSGPFVVTVGNADVRGRVKYDPTTKGGTLRIYATHR
jgi:general secretion pathway protein G